MVEAARPDFLIVAGHRNFTTAIYFHGGTQYQVERLDLEEKKAYVRPVSVDYYTDAELAVRIGVMETQRAEGSRACGEICRRVNRWSQDIDRHWLGPWTVWRRG